MLALQVQSTKKSDKMDTRDTWFHVVIKRPLMNISNIRKLCFFLHSYRSFLLQYRLEFDCRPCSNKRCHSCKILTRSTSFHDNKFISFPLCLSCNMQSNLTATILFVLTKLCRRISIRFDGHSMSFDHLPSHYLFIRP